MRRRTKIITGAIATLALAFSGVGIAQAASSLSASIEGWKISAYCFLGSSGAGAQTSIAAPPDKKPSCSVDATYAYVDVDSLLVGTQSGGCSNDSGCGVSFTAPQNCRSIRIDASHSASFETQSWSGSTSKIY